MFKNSKLIALLILIVAMFVLVACGNNSAGEPADEAEGSPSDDLYRIGGRSGAACGHRRDV